MQGLTSLRGTVIFPLCNINFAAMFCTLCTFFINISGGPYIMLFDSQDEMCKPRTMEWVASTVNIGLICFIL